MNWKKIFFSLVIVLAVLFLISSWHNAYEDGRYDGYMQGSTDAMDFTKTRLAANVSPDDISVDSYDYFKAKMKWNFYDRMWEVEPPAPDIWDFIDALSRVFLVAAFLGGCWYGISKIHVFIKEARS